MAKKKERRPALDCWYEIEEFIAPNNALANVPGWSPCRNMRGRLYREEDAEEAKALFQSLKPGKRFRLVMVTRRVVSEKE